MKKGFLILLLVLILPLSVFSQEENKHFDAGKMVASAGIGISGLGIGYGLGFEYGITDKWGIYPSYTMHSYETGSQTWSFNAFDIWATYHDKSINSWFGNNEKVDAYYMGGVTLVSFGVENTGSKEETSSSFGFGFGAGGRYHFTDKIAAYGEGRYRIASFETDSYKLAIAWYSINVGVSYAIN